MHSVLRSGVGDLDLDSEEEDEDEALPGPSHPTRYSHGDLKPNWVHPGPLHQVLVLDPHGREGLAPF